jgi:hypothetical protein
MAYQRYSVKEALNRIFRLWSGNEPASDEPESLDGEIFSEDEAWSNLAELWSGSLPGESASLPLGVAVNEYGHIFSALGNINGNYPTGVWTTLPIFTSGSFSSPLVTNDFTNNRIVLNAKGYYFVWYDMSANATADGLYIVRTALSGTIQHQTCATYNPLTVLSTGTYHVGDGGLIYVETVPSYLDLRILPDTTGSFNVSASAMRVLRVGP